MFKQMKPSKMWMKPKKMFANVVIEISLLSTTRIRTSFSTIIEGSGHKQNERKNSTETLGRKGMEKL